LVAIARLIMMATASALSIALVSRSQKLLLAATSDPLTGLFNRGYVEDRLSIELSRACPLWPGAHSSRH